MLGTKHLEALGVLSLPEIASWSQVKKRYRQLVREFHPDNYHGPKEEAGSKFKLFQTAYEKLEEPNAKKILESRDRRGTAISRSISASSYMSCNAP